MKMVILVREDLNMPTGKIAAQVGHAVDAREFSFQIEEAWNQNYRTKICLAVDSEEELLKYYNSAKEKSLPVKLVYDKGFTCFKGIETLTCCAIGPAESNVLNKITGHLKLL